MLRVPDRLRALAQCACWAAPRADTAYTLTLDNDRTLHTISHFRARISHNAAQRQRALGHTFYLHTYLVQGTRQKSL